MKADLVGRRMFLRGVGGTLLPIPFLPSVLRGTASAAAPALPRYVHINSNCHLPRQQTYPLYRNPYPAYPQPAGTTPDSVPWMQKDADTKVQSLKAIIEHQGKISWSLDEKWNALASRTNLITNAHAYMADDRHNAGVSAACSSGPGGLMSADVQGPLGRHAYSADWLVEQAWAKSAPTRLPALRVNLYSNDGGYKTFAFAVQNGTPARLPMLATLAELGLRVSGVQDGAAGTGPGPALVNRMARVDSVLDDFRALMAHRRISTVDRQRLANAADMWSGLTKRLASATGTGRCSFPSLGDAPDWGARHRLALDIVATALACGATRAISYGLIHAADRGYDQGTLHGWEHDPRSAGYADPRIVDPYFTHVVRWRSDLVTHFLGKLMALRDENGQPLLDSSVVVWAHQFSDWGHSMYGHALVSVGGAGGRLETGWHVDAGAAPVNRFHLTNLLAVGLGLPEIERAGTPGFGEINGNIRTGDNSNQPFSSERDQKVNDSSKRVYTSRKDHFATASEMRKPFFYLKSA